MNLFSAIKRVLGLQDELQLAFNVAALLVQKIEDTTLTGVEKLAWVKGQLEHYLPSIAPRIAGNWRVNWPKVNAYIDALVALANLAGLFARSVK
jgi:hypothetical protein